MNRTTQNRRPLLAYILALGLTGSGLSSSAEANPWFWALRSGAQAAVIATASTQFVREMNEIHADWHEHDAGATTESRATMLAVQTLDIQQQYSLRLTIPPVSSIICDRLLVVATDLNNGTKIVVFDQPFRIPPSIYFTQWTVPLPYFQQRGLYRQGEYRFEASIPILNNTIKINGTNSVLLL
ncbi:MAG: hypothetical protein KTR32_13050 [Granulosicoccus sp.]|nr:hypothetical protein [Granulosicoccus sp.]